MFDAVRALMTDVTTCLDIVEKITSPTLREAVLTGSHDALLEAASQLVPKKKYVLPKTQKALATLTTKTDSSSFRSVILAFLRESFPERNPKVNAADASKLWTMYKDVGPLDDIIKYAKADISSSGVEMRLRSTSEESI